MRNKGYRTSWWDIAKGAFFVLIAIQILPSVIHNLKEASEEFTSMKEKVGVISLKGSINDSSGFIKQLEKMVSDESIKAIMLKINSPGGSSGSSQIMFNEVLRAKEKKPIISLIENSCASAAYYVAIGGSSIVAPAASFVGSIGTFIPIPNIKKLANNWNIEFDFVREGKYKLIGNPVGEKLTEEDKSYLQQTVKDVYGQFVADVSKHRNISLDNEKEWADGKIFTGAQAKKLGLVDVVGSYSDAKDEIKRLAKISGDIRLVQPSKPSLVQRLFAGDSDDEKISFRSLIQGYVRDFFREALGQISVPSYETNWDFCFV